MEKVLILDANQRSALAATRSLGKRGIPVAVADEVRETIAGASKYCRESFAYPSPSEFPKDFIRILQKECMERHIRMIFPMTDISTYLLTRHLDQFPGLSIPFASFHALDLLSNKWRLFELARELGIPVPISYFVKSAKDVSSISSELRFPVVLKPYRSRILSDGRWIAASVNYAYSLKELEETIATTPYLNIHPFLIQEYIQGEGRGVFTLYNQGDPVTFFAHRRLREKPPSGGISVLSHSI